MRVNMLLRLVGFSIFTGATFNLAQYAIGYFSVSSAAAWRFGLAAVIMVILLAYKERISLASLKQNGSTYVLLGLIGICGFNALFFLGMKYTTPVNAALIMATNPLVTAILSKIFADEMIPFHRRLGIVISLVGVVFVITQGSWEIIRTLAFSKGDLLIFLGNICWALYGVLGKRYLIQSSSFSTTTYTMVIGALCLTAISFFQPSPVPMMALHYRIRLLVVEQGNY